jgi:hypothetical protein
MDVTALVTAWKEIDASQEAAVVINGTYMPICVVHLSVIVLYICPCMCLTLDYQCPRF